MMTRIAAMVLRLCALVAITLGILFWTGHALQLRDIHQTAGVLLVLALWTIAITRVKAPGGAVGLVAALLVGVALAAVGMMQARILPGASHWVIQVVHLALALTAIGIGEALAARSVKAAKRARVATYS